MDQGKAALTLPGAALRQATRATQASAQALNLPQATLLAKRAHAEIRVTLHEDIAELEAQWRRFERLADCTVFQSFAWLSTWLRHIGQQRGTRCVIALGRECSDGRDARGALLFILPLALERRGLVTTLTWLGSDNNDYNAPLLAPRLPQLLAPEDFLVHWRDVLQRIKARPGWRFDLLELVRMPAQLGRQHNPFVSLPVSPHPDRAYLTALAQDWDTFYAGKRSSATRQRERTKRKRLADCGLLAFVTPTDADDIQKSMSELIAQKSTSFARMGARNIFERPGWAAFYRALASGPDAPGFAHVSRLDVGANTGAVNLGLVFQGTYYHLLASHAAGEMARFSPGAAHLQELMRYAIGRGCTVYDFTIGDEAYKRDWSDTQSVLLDHVAAARPLGALVVPARRVQSRIKRFVKQTPLVWNTFMRWRAGLASLRLPAPLPHSPQESKEQT